MQGYTVVDVDEEQLDSAYLLVRAASPELLEEDWLRDSRALDGSAGILGLAGPGGTLVGVLTYRKKQTARHGATLAIDRLVAFDLTRLGSGRRMLLDAALTMAERLGCSAIAYPADERNSLRYKTAIAPAAPVE